MYYCQAALWRSCLKGVYIAVNTLVLILGLAIFGAGVALKIGLPYLQEMLDEVANDRIDLSTHSGVSIKHKYGDALSSFDILPFGNTLSTVLICTGIAIMLLTSIAMCGLHNKASFLLTTQGVFIILLLLTQILLVVLVVSGQLNWFIRTTAHNMIEYNFGGLASLNAQSCFLNGVMLLVGCCGVDNYKDFAPSHKWKRIWIVSVRGSEVGPLNLTAPVACCIIKGTFPDVSLLDPTCPLKPSDQNSYWLEGCFEKTPRYLQENYQRQAVATLTTILVFQGLLAILALILSRPPKQFGHDPSFSEEDTQVEEGTQDDRESSKSQTTSEEKI